MTAPERTIGYGTVHTARCVRACAITLDGATAGSSPGQSVMGLFGHGSDGSTKSSGDFLTDTPEEAFEMATDMGLDDVHAHEKPNGELGFMPGKSHDALEEATGREIDTPDGDPMQMTSDGMGELFTRGNEIFDTDTDGGTL